VKNEGCLARIPDMSDIHLTPNEISDVRDMKLLTRYKGIEKFNVRIVVGGCATLGCGLIIRGLF